MKSPHYPYIAIAVTLLIGCQSKQEVEKPSVFILTDATLARCEFYQAQSTEVKNEIRLFGKISADNNKLAQVFPIMSGIVKSIRVELGDYVEQGHILATIQSSEVAEFQKEKLDATNNVAIAEKNLQVARDLFIGKLNSEKDVIAAEKELEKEKAELTRINEIYSIYNLKDGSIFYITAPISGFVLAKKINQNEQILRENTEPVFSIAEINEVWALANVNESNIANIKVGYEATVNTLAFPEMPFTGKIDKIFNAIDPETKSMKVRVKIPNSDFKLKPDMHCTVAVRFSENKKKIAVPSSAVVFDKSKYWVMIFHDKANIETRKIEIYRQLGNITYIDDGLKENETVISKNALMIFDALND